MKKDMDELYNYRIAANRYFGKKMYEFRCAAREAVSFICETCAKIDFDKKQLIDDWEHYSPSNLKFKKVKYRRINNPKAKLVEHQVDYLCPLGHNICMTMTEEEYEVFKSKDGKKKDNTTI